MKIGFQQLAGVAVMEGRDQRADELFLVGQAEEMGVGDHVGAVAGVAVVVDKAAHVVQETGGNEEEPIPFGEAVEGLPVIKEIDRHGGDVAGMRQVVEGKGLPVIADRSEQHVVLPVFIFSVDRVVVMEKETFPDAAAGNGKVFRLCEAHELCHDERARDDDVCPLGGEAGDAFPFGEVFPADLIDEREKALGGKLVIVQLRQGILDTALVDFRQVAHGAADADHGNGLLGEPRDLPEPAPDIFLHFCFFLRRDGLTGAEPLGERDGAHGDAYGVKALLAADEGDLHAGAAQIEEEKVALVDRVNDAGKSEARFFAAADDRHGDTRQRADPLQEGCAVSGGADSRGGDGEDLRHVKDFGRVGVDFQARQRPLLRRLREHETVSRHAFGETNGFLFLIDQLVRAGSRDLHDNKADGIGTEINNGDAFHGILFSVGNGNPAGFRNLNGDFAKVSILFYIIRGETAELLGRFSDERDENQK